MDERYTIDAFLEKTIQRDREQGQFELESQRILEINLDGLMWMKKGVMVAYRGDITFTREGLFEHGVGKLLKKAFSGEGAQLTKAQGRGKLYLAEEGKKVTLLSLRNETIFVNGNDLLAFEPTLQWDVKMMKRVSAMLAGGLFNVKLSGTGTVAVTSHYDPLTLIVTPDDPVQTDPNATVLWSGDLEPEFKTDMSVKTFFGRGSGESFQMRFAGEGFVVVQPYEERHLLADNQGGG